MNTPSMQPWEAAWQQADLAALLGQYAQTGMIFPPTKPSVQGNARIVSFLSGGIGKVDVTFHPDELIVEENLAFESGVFRDLTRDSGSLIGTGRYAVTWLREEGAWKIKCHGWSIAG